MKALIAALAFAVLSCAPAVQAEDFAPYGIAKTATPAMPVIDTVWDVNYADPHQLNLLYGFIRSASRHTRGRIVVVTHGPELRAFARENYLQYQGEVDRMAELAREGVEFRMCHDALRAAGFEASDMHGFITVVPAGVPELVRLQSRGYQYVNPVPLQVRGVRYLDQPQLKKP